jgi:DNA modification methylase
MFPWLMYGDCLDRMKEIPVSSVDLILADLPYGTTACAWDNIIPLDPLWDHYWRVLKPSGVVALFGSEPFSSQLRMSQFEYYKYDWIWKKDNATGFVNAHKMPMKIHEIISIFYRNLPTYNPQKTDGKPYHVKEAYKTSQFLGSNSSGSNIRNEIINDGDRFPLSFIEFTRDRHKIHPTQKPVSLLEYLVRTYTNEGDTVLDNVMGSGSTGVACKNANRSFIGIERDENYFHIAKKRIENDIIEPKEVKPSIYEDLEI